MRFLLVISTTFAIGALFLWQIRLWQVSRHIRLWKKTLNLNAHLATFQQLYQQVDGFALSQQARTKQDAIDYTYGEIEFIPFAALLSLIKPDEKMVFYDLGSGVGKAVLTCALLYPIKKSVGVELLPTLHQSACQQKERLKHIEPYAQTAQKVHFILGDFLQVDLTQATCIFINSTTIFGKTWEELCPILESLPHLKTVITTSRPLISRKFNLYHVTSIKMSWGLVDSFIHRSE